MPPNPLRSLGVVGRHPEPLTQVNYYSDVDAVARVLCCWVPRYIISYKRTKMCPEFLVCTRIRLGRSYPTEGIVIPRRNVSSGWQAVTTEEVEMTPSPR